MFENSTPCETPDLFKLWNVSLNLLVALCWRTVQSRVPLIRQRGIDNVWPLTRITSGEEGRAPWVTNNMRRDVCLVAVNFAVYSNNVFYIFYIAYLFCWMSWSLTRYIMYKVLSWSDVSYSCVMYCMSRTVVNWAQCSMLQRRTLIKRLLDRFPLLLDLFLLS